MPRKSSTEESETPVSTPSVRKMEMRSTAKKSATGKKKSSTPVKKASTSNNSEQSPPELHTPTVVALKDKTPSAVKKASAKKSTAKKKKSQGKDTDAEHDALIVTNNEEKVESKSEIKNKNSRKSDAALSPAITNTPKVSKSKGKASAKKSAKKPVTEQTDVDAEENDSPVAAVKVQLPRTKTPKSTRGSKRKARAVTEENAESADTPMDVERDQPKKTKTPKSGRSKRKSSEATAASAEIENEETEQIGTQEKKEPSTKKKKSPKSVDTTKKTEKEKTKKRLSFGGDAPDKATNIQQTTVEEPSTKNSSSKKKNSGVKRRTSGKFDLPRLDEDDDTETPTSRKKMRRSAESTPNGTERGTPIKMNTEMTAAKLRLLNQSPLRSKLSKKWLAAAESEVIANENDSDDNEFPSVIALEDADDKEASNEEEESDKEDDPELSRAKRKAARQTKWKARKLREKGKLPSASEDATKTGVVYIGHVPHGFYEREMRHYFKQFGEVSRLRLSRSKKTGRSRGYAFIEFADEQVAEITAKAMDGYLMHGQALVAKFVPPEKVHEETFKGCDKAFKKIAWSAVERRSMIERSRKPEMLAIRCGRVEKSKKRKEATLKKKGLSYDFPEVSSIA